MLSAAPESEMSISGKTVLITGATSGLGLATALLLAERGAEVVMVGRDRTRSNFMRTEVAKCAAGNAPILFLADLSSQVEIHHLAERVHGCFSRIDVLINNAAAVFAEREVTPDGLEKTFAVNHLAPFALTHLLLDLLRAAPAGRILTASSEFHSGELEFSNLQGQRQYNWLGAYKRSKLCNILFTYELSRRLAGSTITANCFSPGPTLTRLGDNMRGLPCSSPVVVKAHSIFACISGRRSENSRLRRVLARSRRYLRQILQAVPKDAHKADYVRQQRRSQALEHESSAV